MKSFRDSKGQITIEFILWVGMILVIIVYSSSMVDDAHELNIAMAAARSGAVQGSNMNSFAIYPERAFLEYESSKERLNFPSSIKILRIETINYGFNSTYNRTRIQLRTHVYAPGITQKTYRDSLGSRINYYIRRSITHTFQTQNLTNNLYNPAFSSKYVFTTANVIWI